MSLSFSKSIFPSNVGKTSSQRGLCAGGAVSFLVQVNDKHDISGTAILSDVDIDGEKGPRRTLQIHELYCLGESGRTVLSSPDILANFQSLPYPYIYFSNDEVSETLGEMNLSVFLHRTLAQR